MRRYNPLTHPIPDREFFLLSEFKTQQPGLSECMGKTFQAASTNTWELFDHRSVLQNIFLISAKVNFHRPLVCSTICHIQYYTPEVGGSSVWQISKEIFCRSDLWSKSTHVLVVAAWNVFPIHSLQCTVLRFQQFQYS